LARVKHPQTNGNNVVRYHESLDEEHYLQTSDYAFWS